MPLINTTGISWTFTDISGLGLPTRPAGKHSRRLLMLAWHLLRRCSDVGNAASYLAVCMDRKNPNSVSTPVWVWVCGVGRLCACACMGAWTVEGWGGRTAAALGVGASGWCVGGCVLARADVRVPGACAGACVHACWGVLHLHARTRRHTLTHPIHVLVTCHRRSSCCGHPSFVAITNSGDKKTTAPA